MTFIALCRLIAPPRKTLAWCLLLMGLSSVLALVHPWLAGQLVNFVLNSDHAVFTTLGSLLGTWLALLVLRNLVGLANDYVTGRAAETTLADLRSRLYDHLLLLPAHYFSNHRRGNVLSILTSDSTLISNFITGTLIQLLPVLITLAGAAVMMLMISPGISLVLLVVLALYTLMVKWLGKRIRPLSRQWIDAYGRLVANIDEVISLMPAVKAYTREPMEAQKFNAHNNELLNLTKRQLMVLTLMPRLTNLLAGAGMIALIWLGYDSIAAGDLTPAELVSLAAYAMLLNQPLSQLAGVYGQTQNARGSAERIQELLKQSREPDGVDLPELKVSHGEVEFRDLCFSYPGASRPVLSHLNLHIRRGEPVVITGENGSGKSTMAHLLMQLMETGGGSILIDGTPINSVSIKSLRGNIGLVAQNTLLLHGTAADNIAWGLPHCTQSQIEQAAKKAKAHDFITQLPQGYQTNIGDQGLKLSGGQRQRLSLARALLKDPPILVFDEATSMMDPVGEASFLADCQQLFQDRTVLFITHRPESLTISKRVLQLKEGQLIPNSSTSTTSTEGPPSDQDRPPTGFHHGFGTI